MPSSIIVTLDRNFKSLGLLESQHGSHSSESKFVFDLPNEIQKQIFEEAAKLDGKCAYNLMLVARYVYEWAYPILYERVVVRSPAAASCLLRTLKSKPRGYFSPLIKSLAFGSSVTLPQAKPLLVECSRHLLLFTLFRNTETEFSQTSFLDFIRSPFLRRLTLVCEGWSQSKPSLTIPLGFFSSLTHLTIVAHFWHQSWGSLVDASVMAATPGSPNYSTAYWAFQNLTHFAGSLITLPYSGHIRTVAKNLRYFVILEGRYISVSVHNRLVQQFRSQQHQVHVLILKDLGDSHCWSIDDAFRPSEFWKNVERLVEDGYISDQGDRL